MMNITYPIEFSIVERRSSRKLWSQRCLTAEDFYIDSIRYIFLLYTLVHIILHKKKTLSVPNITHVVNMYTFPKIQDDLQPSQLSAWVIFTIHQPLAVLTLPQIIYYYVPVF